MPIKASVLDSMIERFEAEQSDLEALCSPGVRRSCEVWPGNADYGSAEVLRRYAGLRRGASVCAVIPHGIYFDRNALSPSERDAHLPAVLVFPDYLTPMYRRGTRMATIPSASPYVYADALVEDAGTREGTLFFLAHSTPLVRAKVDWEALAAEVASLPERMRPVSVMVYWQDYLHGHHRPFEDRGLRIVSAGHSDDPEFLLRLAYLIKRHRYAASNGIGSYIFYTTHSGLPFRLWGSRSRYEIDDEAGFAEMARTTGGLEWPPPDPDELLVRTFSVDAEAPTPEQLELSDYYLGREHMLEPDRLASLLRWLASLDKLGPLALRSPIAEWSAVERGRLPIVPAFLSRAPYKALRLLRLALRDPGRVLRRFVGRRSSPRGAA